MSLSHRGRSGAISGDGPSYQAFDEWLVTTALLRQQGLDAAAGEAHWKKVDRYAVILLVLALALVPLFYFSFWAGLAALLAIYLLVARLATKDLDRQHRKTLDLAHRIRKR